LHKVWGSFRP